MITQSTQLHVAAPTCAQTTWKRFSIWTNQVQTYVSNPVAISL